MQTALQPEISDMTDTVPITLNDAGSAWWQALPTQATSHPEATDATTSTACRSATKRPMDTKQAPRSQDVIELLERDRTTMGALPRAIRQARTDLVDSLPPTPPLKHDWKDFIYTDGSVITSSGKSEPIFPAIGAGVYIPRTETYIPVHCFQDNDKSHPACVNTINRAELAAIEVAVDEALAQTNTGLEIHIATDSLSSIFQVRRANTRPQDMNEHRHFNVITSIAEKIGSSGCTIHLWKVRSHIGIVGNEIADELAVGVSKGKISHVAPGTDRYDTPSNDRSDMYWLYTEHEIEHHDNGPTVGAKKAQVAYVPMPNMAEALKKHVHGLRKLGRAN